MMSAETKIFSMMSNQAAKCSLHDIRLILSRFKFSPHKFKIITIAGTNGKGTTVTMLEEMLIANNKKVLSHVSPHIFRFNERINLNKVPVADSVLFEILERLTELTPDYSLGYYEIAFLCCCMLSQKVDIDYLILEVGLGGRLDCANVIDADITAITNISLDHCERLGDTVDKIGIEKVAISRKGVPLFLGSDMPKSVTNYAYANQALVLKPRYKIDYKECFVDSYNIAMGISEYLLRKGEIVYIPSLEKVRAPARYLSLKSDDLNDSYVIVDVAHNEASVEQLFRLISNRFENKKIRYEAIFGILASKDLETIIKIAKEFVHKWNIVDLKNIDDRALEISKIKQEFKKQGIIKADFHKDLSSVYLSKKDTVTIVFGSFVMAGEFLREYEKNS